MLRQYAHGPSTRSKTAVLEYMEKGGRWYTEEDKVKFVVKKGGAVRTAVRNGEDAWKEDDPTLHTSADAKLANYVRDKYVKDDTGAPEVECGSGPGAAGDENVPAVETGDDGNDESIETTKT